MMGDAGNDTLNGGEGNDLLLGDSGNDSLLGGIGNDSLFGGEDDDTLNGGSGNDLLLGGTGNDTYFVDSGDTISEGSNAGIDTVVAGFDFILGDNLENLTLRGISADRGEGNNLDNKLTVEPIFLGTVPLVANTLLLGRGGNDELIGSLRNDTLDGGTGNDTMSGGLGNDTYIVDSTRDKITEAVNAGIDTVESSISFTLGENLENLTLTGTANRNGTGNALDNVIEGNDGNNVLKGEAGNDQLLGGSGGDTLDGGTGNDIMRGGALSDTYIVDSVGDVVIEDFNITFVGPELSVLDGGVDTVQASVSFTLGNFVENLTLTGTDAINGTGNTLGNTLTGNSAGNTLDGKEGNDRLNGEAGNDILIGGAGIDTLNGGAGNDILIGGADSDRFLFNSGDPFTAADLGVDIIKDFQVGIDKIQLSQSTFGTINATQIAIVASDIDAATSTGVITYSVATGSLFFNQNGAAAGFGSGGEFASVDNAPLLSTTDFQIVA
jgi:Ca2+-binding RTX toxin-like protein